jgi:hypothetical protein
VGTRELGRVSICPASAAIFQQRRNLTPSPPSRRVARCLLGIPRNASALLTAEEANFFRKSSHLVMSGNSSELVPKGTDRLPLSE